MRVSPGGPAASDESETAPTAAEPESEPPRPSAAPSICVVASEETRRTLVRTLTAAGHSVAGPDAASSASVVITEAQNGDPAETVRRQRRLSRADAATIVVLDRACPPDSVRAASEAGAFACLRPSLAPADVEGVVAAASARYTPRTGIADRSRSLDLDSHLTSLGRFTAGLLHELKNPLAVVDMNVNLVRDDLPTLLEAREHIRAMLSAAGDAGARDRARAFLGESEPIVADLEAALSDARSGLDRMRAMLNRLHGFALKDARPLEQVDLGAVVTDLCAELRRHPRAPLESVELEVDVEGDVAAFAVRESVEEIVRHLVTNAVQAARRLSSPRVRVHAYARDAERVVVSVRDNGPGIALDAQEAIFEPFYTTRRDEGAAGLGLALCREHAAQMGAQLSVWSVPGRGACFRLALKRPIELPVA